MATRSFSGGAMLAAAAAVLIAAAVVVETQAHGTVASLAPAALAIAAAVAYLVWHAEPAWTLSIGLVLSVFSGNWGQLGLPGVAGPDRLILLAALGAIALRAPGSRGRPRLFFRPVHWVLLAALAYVVCSAVAVGTFFSNETLALILQRFGLIPFLVFLCAPVAFRTERQRRVLLVALIVLGAYLGLTALFEAVGADALVFPRYISDPNVGIQPDRARGPFVEPATFGVGLFVCLGGCVLGLRIWRRGLARVAIMGIAALCAAGLLFTLTRQVWVAGVVGVVVAAIDAPRLRSRFLPLAVAAVVALGVLLVAVPGLSDKVTARADTQQSVWDRYNLNDAAINAIEAHPLFGVGFNAWTEKNLEYFQLNPTYPLNLHIDTYPIHNVFLSYAAELGLVGAVLWGLGFLGGIGNAVLRRGPPEVAPWRTLALAVFAFVLVVGNFEYPQAWSFLIVWLLAGVAVAPQLWRESAERQVAGLPVESA